MGSVLKLLLGISEEYSSAPIRLEMRAPSWSTVARQHLESNPACAVCGHKKNLNVHHIYPFHLYPERELDPENLITLGVKCPTGNHHLLFGHFGNWQKFNPDVIVDSRKFFNGFRSFPVGSVFG